MNYYTIEVKCVDSPFVIERTLTGKVQARRVFKSMCQSKSVLARLNASKATIRLLASSGMVMDERLLEA